MIVPFRHLLLVALLCLAGPVLADDKPPVDHDKALADKTGEDLLKLLPADSVTQHSLQAGGQHLAYTATAGTLTLRNDKGERTALVFYVAYTLPGAAAAQRPVSFFFNGGPGASSAYLHLGAAGPQVLDFPAGNETDGAAARLKDNPDTWLPFTDMVFIDAVGTGWSRPAKLEDAPKAFWGVKQDAATFAKIVSLWLERNGRDASPKYLVGESYGGIRSIKVASALQSDQGVILNGIVMVSPAIEMSFTGGETTNPLPDALRLPSFVAGNLERQHRFSVNAVEDAYKYALGDYLKTIVEPPLDGDAAKAFYGRLADLTGIKESVIASQRGRIDYTAHDVRSLDGRLYSFYENTLSVADPFPEGGDQVPDPVLDGYTRAYGAAFAGYAADALGYRSELTYKLLAMDVNQKWEWRGEGESSASPAGGFDDLRRLLALDPSLKILIAHGYFDLICPFAADRWLVDQLPVGRDRVTLKVYPGGHMIYSRAASRALLRADVAALYPSSGAH